MEKRPPANVGDLGRQREKHLLAGTTRRSLVRKAEDPVLAKARPLPASFLPSWDMQPLFHGLIPSANIYRALLCSLHLLGPGQGEM